jgi:hypothetical protein
MRSSPPVTDALADARERTLALVSAFSDADLETQHVEIMSPLVWDLAHIAAYEELWLVHRQAGLPLSRPELAAMYDAFETPRAVRGDLPLLDRAQALEYLESVRERVPAARPRPAATPASSRSRSPPARASWARRRAPSATTTSARATARSCPPSGSAARRSPTPRSCTSSRAAATSAARGGATRHGRGRRSTTSRTRRAGTVDPRAGAAGRWTDGRRSIRTSP